MSDAAALNEPAENTLIVRQLADGVLRLTLNNPPANALSIAVLEQLSAELDAARDDEAVRVVVIAAAGKVFCAGHDLKELTAHRSDSDRGPRFLRKDHAAVFACHDGDHRIA